MDARYLYLALFALVLSGCTTSRPSSSPVEDPSTSEVPLTVTPEHPRPGQSVTVSYHPAAPGAALRASDTLELVYRTEVPAYQIVPMKRRGTRWTAQITPDSSAHFLRFYVQSDSVKDQNGGGGWGRMLYGAEGHPVRGAHAARADFYRRQHEGVANRDSLLMAAYREELARYPDHLVARAHLRALQAERDTARAQALRRAVLATIDSVRAHTDDPQKLREVQRAYHALGRINQAQEVRITLAERVPQGPEAALIAFRRATADGMSAARAQRRAEAFLGRFPHSFFESGVYESLFKAYREARETEKMLRAGRQWVQAEQINRARAHGELARALAGAGQYEAAVAQARRAIEAASEAPTGYTLFKTEKGWDWARTPLIPKERRSQARRQQGRQRALLGRIYYRRQEYAKAAKVLARAVEENPSEAAAWAHLGQAYDKTGKPERAYAAAQEALRRQPSLRPARSLFRRLYVQRHGSEKGLQDAVAQLARGKLLRDRLDEPAPALRLTGLASGDSLRTEGLKGKVLVLDFWASWCGPCHQAFPHLQTAYEAYRDVADVKFLVINTSWRDTKARARRFIEEEGYTFPLYWDAGGQVARAFGVRGLPTTVLVGKDGRIQYREAGFGGPERYVENLTMRIDLLRELEAGGSEVGGGGPRS